MYTNERNKIIEIFKNKGIHITENRVTLYSLIREQKNALSINYINKHFSSIIDRVSIYRIIKIFIDKGLLLKVINAEKEAAYIFNDNEITKTKTIKNRIAYFVCIACKSTIILNENLYKSFKLPQNMQITNCQLIIEGKCKKCKN